MAKSNLDLYSYSNIIYVDAVKGSDTNDGSKSKPLRTLPTAILKVKTNNTAIILAEGTYDVASLATISGSSYSIDIIGLALFDAKRQSSINLLGTYNTTYKMKAKYRYLGIIFRRGAAGDARVWEYWYNGSTFMMEFHNCVFTGGSLIPTTNVLYTANNSSSTLDPLLFKNCLITPNLGGIQTGASTTGGTFQYCAARSTTILSRQDATNISVGPNFDPVTLVLNDPTKNEIYGLYAGQYPWDGMKNHFLIKHDNVYKKIDDAKKWVTLDDNIESIDLKNQAMIAASDLDRRPTEIQIGRMNKDNKEMKVMAIFSQKINLKKNKDIIKINVTPVRQPSV
ncbi:DUF1565 domain-containing protein [Lysinibacillus fusiformis]|uniref:DUF1565 domain-containing protein n=1 Tax=Lysinibacillus fusiformis TaxID=28031 RepID=UPI00046AE01C|nr:DUF1565 domain-containing protein [Lysinibacillus fusiformis]